MNKGDNKIYFIIAELNAAEIDRNNIEIKIFNLYFYKILFVLINSKNA